MTDWRHEELLSFNHMQSLTCNEITFGIMLYKIYIPVQICITRGYVFICSEIEPNTLGDWASPDSLEKFTERRGHLALFGYERKVGQRVVGKGEKRERIREKFSDFEFTFTYQILAHAPAIN